MLRTAVIIPAAGIGSRAGLSVPKTFLHLGGISVLRHTIRKFLNIPEVVQIIIATREDRMEEVQTYFEEDCPNHISWKVIAGGKERQQSIENALIHCQDVAAVAVHDAVRPFFDVEIFRMALAKLQDFEGVILATPVKDTIKIADENKVIASTPDRSMLWQAQTPQVFRKDALLEAYQLASANKFLGTDDASLLEFSGKKVGIVESTPANFKITYPIDIILAEHLINTERK